MSVSAKPARRPASAFSAARRGGTTTPARSDDTVTTKQRMQRCNANPPQKLLPRLGFTFLHVPQALAGDGLGVGRVVEDLHRHPALVAALTQGPEDRHEVGVTETR